MKNKLSDYIKGKTDYVSLINYMHHNVYEILGKYAYKEIFKEKLPKSLN